MSTKNNEKDIEASKKIIDKALENLETVPQNSVDKAEVAKMINEYIASVGLEVENTYNKEHSAWYWTVGSAKIELFIQEIKMQEGHSRFFLRIFSPLLEVPEDDPKVYRYLLELNDSKLGVKLSLMPKTNTVFATYERDINGLEYSELQTFIQDMEYWADILDDQLKEAFGIK